MYAPVLRQHALEPHNQGPLTEFTGYGESDYPPCGDKLKLWILIEGDVIQNVSFVAAGCGPLTAVASLATDWLKGKTVDQAKQLDSFELDRLAGGLPTAKRHTYLLALDALAQALQDAREKRISHV
jgi:nitrogen fixation NifU-like protein